MGWENKKMCWNEDNKLDNKKHICMCNENELHNSTKTNVVHSEIKGYHYLCWKAKEG